MLTSGEEHRIPVLTPDVRAWLRFRADVDGNRYRTTLQPEHQGDIPRDSRLHPEDPWTALILKDCLRM
jgi:hypothetical protein